MRYRTLLTAAAGATFLAAPAQGASISGSVAGTPRASQGVASVRAVDLTSGVVTATTRTRRGRYTLDAPAGVYGLFATTTPFSKTGTDRLGAVLRLTRK